MSNRGSNAVFSGGIQQTDVMKDSFGYEVPVESVPLPSLGKVYPEGSPLHGQETVEIRAMTAREEDILTSRALIKKGTVITHLIQSCLTNKAIDVKNMISGDRNALMISLRIEVKTLDIDPVVPGTNEFEFVLPVTKKKVHFKFLTGADEEEIAIVQERKKKSGFQSDNLVTTRLMYSIVSIDGIADKSKINGFIRNMPARDSLALRRFIDQNEPGIDMKSWMSCQSCFTDSEVRLPLGATFFWPDS
jgi:hypothetical protein